MTLQAEHAALKEEHAARKEEQATAQAAFGELQGKHAGLEAEHATLQTEHAAARAALATLEGKHAGLAEELARTQARVAELEALTAEQAEAVLAAETTRRRMHNQIQDLKGNIRVFCRVRPTTKAEGASVVKPQVTACHERHPCLPRTPLTDLPRVPCCR